VIQKNCYWQ